MTPCGFCTKGVIVRNSMAEPCPYCDGTGLAPQDDDGGEVTDAG